MRALAWVGAATLAAGVGMAQPVGIGGGGAFFGPSINPADGDEIYVGSDMSELFHSTDFGRSFELVPFTVFQGGVYGIVRFTSNPSVLYGLSTMNDLPTPVKSTDGGATFDLLPGDPAGGGEETYSLFVQYDAANRVLLSTYDTLWVSNDGGASFDAVHTAATGAGLVVGGVFFDGSSVYVGTNDGLLVSTDGGANFATSPVGGIPAGQVIWGFTGARTGGTTRFFCITAAAGDVYVGVQPYDYYGFPTGVYSLDYGVGSWTARMTGIAAGTDFPMYVAMAESDVTHAYLGGSNTSGEPNVLRMTDAGTGWSWSHTFTTASNGNVATGWCGAGGDRGWGYAEVAFSLVAARTDPNRLLFTDFGFIHVSTDGGTTWRQSYLAAADENPAGASTPKRKAYHGIGAEDTTCWQLLWVDADHVWAAFSDIRAIRSTDGGASWSFDYSGLNANTTYRFVRHPQTGVLYAATSAIHDLYQSTRLADNPLDNADSEGKILFSVNGGSSWSLLHSFGHPVFWLALDPNVPNRMYASVVHSTLGGVYVSNDINLGSSSTWTKLPNPPRSQGHPASLSVLVDGSLLATYSGRRTGSGFTASSGCFLYTPALGTWADRSASGMLYWTKDAVVYPYDASQSTWYVGVFSGWGGPPNGLGGLYRTTDRGLSWARIWDQDRVTSITFDPSSSARAYVTTETGGLWDSSNITAPTPTMTRVPEYPFRQPERVFHDPHTAGRVWVTSFGNGIRILTPACGPLGAIGNGVMLDETGGLTIHWPDVAGEAGYDVYESPSATAPFPSGWTLAFQASAGTTSWTTTAGSGDRFFRVRSRDACGNVQD